VKTDEIVSAYYPPRARWYGRLLSPWFALLRVSHLDPLHLPAGVHPLLFLVSLFVPGFSFWVLGRRALGAGVLGAYCTAGLLFIVALGYPVAGICYGVLISAHATSVFYLELRWLEESRFGLKVFVALATLLVTWQVCYSPLQRLAGRHWFVPLHVRQNVVIVRPAVSAAAVNRGDWIVYSQREAHIAEARDEGIYVRAGDGYGRVLAVTGDHIRFSTNAFMVNGIAHPLYPYMPTKGRLVVPGKHWFIWPDFDMGGRGNVNAAAISATLQRLALVSDERLIGKPFQHWFWRRQVLGPGS
jgi:hypothetical protein